jgi:hypothetical protein
MADPASADADWSSRRRFNMAASLHQSALPVAVVEIALPVIDSFCQEYCGVAIRKSSAIADRSLNFSGLGQTGALVGKAHFRAMTDAAGP